MSSNDRLQKLQELTSNLIALDRLKIQTTDAFTHRMLYVMVGVFCLILGLLIYKIFLQDCEIKEHNSWENISLKGLPQPKKKRRHTVDDSDSEDDNNRRIAL